MTTADRILRMLLLPFAALALGCNREPPVTPVEPVAVVVSLPITDEPVEDWDVYTGTVASKDPVNINARVRGTIMDVLFKEGEDVAKDKVLFLIDDRPFQADLLQAKGQLLTWEGKLKAAKEKVAIYRPLAEKGTISKEELIQAEAAEKEAEGNKLTAEGKIKESQNNIAYCKIEAPVPGKTGLALLTKGNIVNAGTTENLLTTIIPQDPLYVYFYVSEGAFLDYQAHMLKRFEEEAKKKKAEAKEQKPEPKEQKPEPKEKKEQKAEGKDEAKNKKPDVKNKENEVKDEVEEKRVPVRMGLKNSNGYPFKGVVDFVDNQVDKNGLYKVRARFENPKAPNGVRMLTPGLFARVQVQIGDPYTPIQIAERAILSDQSLKYVLVVNKNNVVQRADVVLGRLQDDGLRVIDSGLKGDERIIVDGINLVRPGDTVDPKTTAPMPRRPKAK